MAQGFDLDELERLLAAATPGEWALYGDCEISAGNLVAMIECMFSETEATDKANAALIVAARNSLPAMLTAIRELRAEVERWHTAYEIAHDQATENGAQLSELRAENARLKSEVVTFCGPWAAQYAREIGLEPGHLHPTHYDILEKAGARMANFTRAALGEPQ